jgi:fructosamine-3-kinase
LFAGDSLTFFATLRIFASPVYRQAGLRKFNEMNLPIEKHLHQLLSDKLNLKISAFQFYSVGGGSINDTYQLTINHNINFFLKINSATKFPGLFQKEKNGLEFIRKQKLIHVPAVIACDEIDNCQILLLEWINKGIKTPEFWNEFGKQLAALHHITNPHFGFFEDNYMGALPQINNPQKSWIDFFIESRLKPQIELAQEKKLFHIKHVSAFESLYPKLTEVFNQEKPSLLHGDLWSGNYICNQNSEPVLIDPAVYFGHRSIDLGMTNLFGGLDKSLYDSYNYYFPFPLNYYQQWDICNLYPLLIHLNLFGSGYLGHIESILKKFV